MALTRLMDTAVLTASEVHNFSTVRELAKDYENHSTPHVTVAISTIYYCPM